MTPQPFYAHIVLGLVMLLAGWVCWRYFWRRHALSSSMSAAFGGVFIAVVFACFPAVFLIQALATGEVHCLSRRCGELSYSLLTEPMGYWSRVALLALLCMFFLSATPLVFQHRRHRKQDL